MKKKIYLFIAVIICLSFSSYAQIEKGDWLLGGTLGVNNSSNSPNGTSTSNANIAPHIAYAVGKNSTIGLNLGYSYSDNSGNYKLSSFASNIFYKKYFPCKEKFGIYLQLNTGIALSKNSYTVIDSAGSYTKSNSTTHSYNVGAIPGIYYLVSKRVLLTADCGGLSYFYDDYGAGYSANSWSFNFLTNFTFGVDFVLGKK
jgi:hypothetical protein